MAAGIVNVGVNENRYCTRHHGYAPRKGGVSLKSPDGLRERWVCERCHHTAMVKISKAFGLSEEFAEALIEVVV
jgi:hypothetical protein